MAIYKPQSEFKTTLASAISTTDTSITLSEAPTETAGYLVLEPRTTNSEIIKYTGVTGTTVTGVVRGLAKSGYDDATVVTANCKSHAAGVEVSMTDTHYFFAKLQEIFSGQKGTGYENYYIGNSADNDISFYADNGDVARPFWRYDASENAWVVSNDGVTSYVISNGGSGVTAGDGIDITGGAVAVDVALSGGLKMSAVGGDNQVMVDATATNVFTRGYKGSANAATFIPGLSAVGNSSLISEQLLPYGATKAEIDQVCDGVGNSATAANINTLVTGPTSGADALHTHDAFDMIRMLMQSGTYSVMMPDITDISYSGAIFQASAMGGGGAYVGGVYSQITCPASETAGYVWMTNRPPSWTLAKDMEAYWIASIVTTARAFFMGIGSIGEDGTVPLSANSLSAFTHIGFWGIPGSAFCSNANGTAQTVTYISGLNLSANNDYRIDHVFGSAVSFYVNDSLKATHTTNIPADGGGGYRALAFALRGNASRMQITNNIFLRFER